MASNFTTLKDTIFNLDTGGKKDAISYGKDNKQYYIRLGALLQFIQDKLIYNIKTAGNNIPMLLFDYDENTNLMFIDNLQISTNPNICMVNRDLLIGGTVFKFIEQGEKFINEDIISPTNSLYGKIMNIYINCEWLLTKMDEIKDDKNRSSLIDFLRSILKGINEAFGGINSLDVIIDEEINTVKIIDDVPFPDIKSVTSYLNSKNPNYKINNDIIKFDIYGYSVKNGEGSAGFIKDFSFKTELSPEFSTMITVGAAANSSVVGENATTLSRLNSGLTDRFKESINNPTTTKNNSPEIASIFNLVPKSINLQEEQLKFKNNEEFRKLKEQFENTYIQFLKYVRSISKGDEVTQEQTKTYKDTLCSLIQYKQQFHKLALQREYANKGLNPSQISQPNTRFIPFNLSITMDGLSGMKIYNQFNIDSSYLPSNYPNTVKFLIKNINHSIENSKWTTTLESFCISTGVMCNQTGQDLDPIGQTSPKEKQLPPPPLSITPSMEKIYNFFLGKGFTTFQSAAWVGNLKQESGLNPSAKNPSSGAYGLAQWLGIRKLNLLKKPNYSDLQVQLNYIWEELQSTEKKAFNIIKNTSNLETATIAIRKNYERPGELEANDSRRLSYANDILNKLT